MGKFKTEIKWGIIFVLTTLIWNFLEKSLGFHGENIAQHAVVSNFFMIPAFFIYVLGIREKREKDLGGTMTFKQGFIAGMIITLVVTVFTPLTQYLVSTVITPDYFQNKIDYSVEIETYTQEEAENVFNLQSYMVQSTLLAPAIGAVTSLLIALFMKKS
ncbi:DUF4199 domain-containing protein [Aureicoccus marinus]|uniref:DUF4199 domain-containing protein n=1 Tax=Aureicoccus marinus TaxID=754435 RepID=A0A2S7T7Z2_9FLAO|nr:DUF4199 domain-containing protein [Aureicoccus marinus]PQJ16053.1 DUF4199 domain-containing protein [Aureicoccus marinus]